MFQGNYFSVFSVRQEEGCFQQLKTILVYSDYRKLDFFFSASGDFF